MARRCYQKAASGQCPAPSACRWFGPTALVRLEPQRTPARLYPAGATPTHRDELASSHRRFVTPSRRDPVPCAASALAPLMGRAAGSQCASSNSRSRHDQALRHPSHLCCIARVGGGLTPPFPAVSFLLLGQLRCSEPHLMAFFLVFPHLLPFWLPIPLILPSLRGSTSSSERHSLLKSG